MAAGAADVIMNSASSVAAGLQEGRAGEERRRRRARLLRLAPGGEDDSPIKDVRELAGKKVGITSAGSGTDILALWTQADRKIQFTRVPLGGGGLVPNLLSGNIDATVLYSPLTYKMFIDKHARSLIDFGSAVPPHLTGAWIATDKFIKEQAAGGAEDAQRALWRVAFLQTRRTAPTP